MIGPSLDARQQVRCQWEGQVGTSESTARLHGAERLRNLCPNPSATSLMTHISAAGSLKPVDRVILDDGPAIRCRQTTGASSTFAFGVRWRMPSGYAKVGDTVAFQADVLVPSSNQSSTGSSARVGLLGVNTPGSDASTAIDWMADEWVTVRMKKTLTSLGAQPNYAYLLIGGYEWIEGEDQAFFRRAAFYQAPAPAVFFDGSTTDPEVLMALYASLSTPPPPL